MQCPCRKFLSVLLVLALLAGACPLGALAAEEPGATAEGEDFSFSNGYITGLTEEFLQGLTVEQKRHIKLVFPDEIRGQAVTGIQTSAFFAGQYPRYSGCGFELDFSQTTRLTTIEMQAFLTTENTCVRGELHLPDTVTAIGNKAFSNDGNPGTDGFQGALRLPSSLESLGTAAFSYQRKLTEIVFPEDFQIAKLDSTFRGCSGLTGVLRIPEGVRVLTGSAFSETQYSTVYLPKGVSFENSNVFFGSGVRTLVCAREDYEALKQGKLSSTYKNKLGYPVSLSLQGGTGEGPAVLERLYSHPLNLVQEETGDWVTDPEFRLPELPEAEPGYQMKWAFHPDDLAGVTEKSPVAGETLVPVRSVSNPVFTFSEDLHKECDGTPNLLSVQGEHPLYRPASSAEEGDVCFYYWWYWNTIGSSPVALKGFDKNVYDVGGVRSSFAISCYVVAQAYLVKEDNKAKKFYEERHEFVVDLRKGTPILLPELPEGPVLTDTLPEIALSPGSPAGTIAWKEGQTVQPGWQPYFWSFTPKDTASYTNAEGSCYLFAGEPPKTEELEEQAGSLPPAPDEGSLSREQQEQILETKLSYEALQEKKEELSEESQKAIHQALLQLPQVLAEASGVELENKEPLLENMEGKHVQAVLSDPDATYQITVAAREKQPEAEEQRKLEGLLGQSSMGTVQEVTVTAELSVGGRTILQETLHSLAKPVKLVFSIPEDLRQKPGGPPRTFSIIRLHDNGGQLQAVKLLDEDASDSTVTVTSADFSLFALVYEEETLHTGGGGIPEEPAELFRDIAGHWAEQEIRSAAARGLFFGTAEGLFSPEEPMTRAMLATVLHRMAGCPAAEGGAVPFTDVKPGAWYYDAVRWAYANGIVNGCGNLRFAPEEKLTREQMAAMLYRMDGNAAVEERPLEFTDAAAVSDWAEQALRWAVERKILFGEEGNRLAPQAKATRAQGVVVLVRFLAQKGLPA